ncbi:MAG: hypothetical protein ACSLEN_02330 [Candidatus Malihini olakiniferum]
MMGALGGMALSCPAATVAPPALVPQKWDTTVDVLIIKKMPLFGGNSILNGSGFKYAAGTGIKDSPELMYQDMMKAGNWLNYPELVRVPSPITRLRRLSGQKASGLSLTGSIIMVVTR